MSDVQPIPPGYHTLTPYLIVDDAATAIDFYKSAFGANELLRLPGSNGKIGHAELRIGDSVVMLADESPQRKAFSPKTVGGSPVSLTRWRVRSTAGSGIGAADSSARV